MQTSDFDYDLPEELVAQTPIEQRDESRLMVLDRAGRSIIHRNFFHLPELLQSGDVLVFNRSRVIPARIYGRREGTGGRVELLLLKRISADTWEAMVKPAKRLKTGARIILGSGTNLAEIIREEDEGLRVVRFWDEKKLLCGGEVPLPPYIHHKLEDNERYQTVYSSDPGSVAAPTSGLHFTPELINRLQTTGIQTVFVTLHIGLDTFRPIKNDDPCQHVIHTEYGRIEADAGRIIQQARSEGRRVISVGTSTARLLEQAGSVQAYEGWTDLFILPGHRFKVIDGLITNFHLPRSSLLMLVSAFAGHEFIMSSYREAIQERYRFYSFGDAMLIL